MKKRSAQFNVVLLFLIPVALGMLAVAKTAETTYNRGVHAIGMAEGPLKGMAFDDMDNCKKWAAGVKELPRNACEQADLQFRPEA